jgi:hypothetical protein
MKCLFEWIISFVTPSNKCAKRTKSSAHRKSEQKRKKFGKNHKLRINRNEDNSCSSQILTSSSSSLSLVLSSSSSSSCNNSHKKLNKLNKNLSDNSKTLNFNKNSGSSIFSFFRIFISVLYYIFIYIYAFFCVFIGTVF